MSFAAEDIDGARPKDPWEPFNSRVTVQPKVPGKALRDPNRVDDVDGAKTRTQVHIVRAAPN